MNENVKTNSELNDNELEVVSGGVGQLSENSGKRYNVGDVIKVKYKISEPPYSYWVTETVTVVEVKADGTYKVRRQSGGISDFPDSNLLLDE